jgi:hypothetical protein
MKTKGNRGAWRADYRSGQKDNQTEEVTIPKKDAPETGAFFFEVISR